MDWLERMNRAMDYIERNLTETVDISKAAQMACCSTYHFQRMFSFITNVPLSEYIRRRRLTLAAFELQSTDAKIIDMAFNYGYESPEAFSRAFSKLHGVTPMSARDKGVALKAYPRMSFHISIKGDCEMNYRIEEKDAFEVFGLELQTNVIDGQCYKEIPSFWESCEKDGRCVALANAAGKKPNDKISFDMSGDSYFVYNETGEYLGKSNTKLPYATRYYFATEKIDMSQAFSDTSVTAPPKEVTPVETVGTGTGAPSTDEKPDGILVNVNDNPTTGR